MEKIKKIYYVLFMLTAMNNYAQKSEIIRTGLIRAQLTLSPSYMFSDKNTYIYLHGNLEGFLNKKISVSGECYYYLGNQSSNKSKLDYNHNLFFGFSRHFTKNTHDLYLGIQPGFALTKLNADQNYIPPTKMGLNPVFSAVLGYNFFVNKVFHFFVQTRFIAGEHTYDMHRYLNEFRFSAGLGFNLNTMKAKL